MQPVSKISNGWQNSTFALSTLHARHKVQAVGQPEVALDAVLHAAFNAFSIGLLSTLKFVQLESVGFVKQSTCDLPTVAVHASSTIRSAADVETRIVCPIEALNA